jgi:hypothetical protein
MKQIFLYVALLLGSFVLNSANVFAETVITPVDPDSYQDGVEKFIGAIVPGTDYVRSFSSVGFTVPDSLEFTLESPSLAVGQYYDLSDVRIIEDILWLNVNFRPLSDAPFGDLLDTLRIEVAGTDPFTLPIRGRTPEFIFDSNGAWFPYPVLPGDTSEVITVSIVTVNQRPERFNYSIPGPNSAFTYQELEVVKGIPITTVTLGIQFEPPAGAVSTVFEDSLVVTHDTYPGLRYSIPLKGTTSHISATPHDLEWAPIPVGKAVTQNVTVETKATIDSISIDDGTVFSFQRGPGWDPSRGGILEVTFAPNAAGPFTGGLTLMSATDTVTMDLMGLGGETPEISFDENFYDFGNITVGETALSSRRRVVLSNPLGSFLSDPGALKIEDENGVFFIESIQPGSYTTRPDTVYVIVSFTPNAPYSYSGKLWAYANYADSVSLDLEGYGKAAAQPQQAPQQATAIDRVAETGNVPSLLTRDGDIIVSGAPAGSVIQVYNLQGATLKTQTVASDVEVLNTAAFPKSVYIVLVNDRNEVILRRKVIL